MKRLLDASLAHAILCTVSYFLPYCGCTRNIGFKSLTEQIDTTTPGGKLIFHIFGALAEFERNLIRERTNAGLKAAKARGRLGGRPKAINKIDPKTLALAKQLYETNQTPNEQLWTMLKVSEATFYRIVKTWKQPDQEGNLATASRFMRNLCE